MTEFLIMILVIPATAFVILQLIIQIFAKRITLRNRLLQKGYEAQGLLLSMRVTENTVKKLPVVRLEIQVQPMEGRNFVSEATELLTHEDINRLIVGKPLKVKYNPMNRKKVMLLR